MAKDFPYFKFYVSEWNDKDITLCSLRAQGLFINLCAMYWSRLGDLKYSRATRKYKYPSLFRELLDEGIIDRDEDKLIIKFLDSQLEDRNIMSIRNTKNIQKRYEKDTSSIQVVEESNTIKKREDKKREDNTFIVFWNMYGKKIDKLKCEKKWAKLKAGEINKIMDQLPDYIKSTPDIQYRKNPYTYLNNGSWNNEIVKKESRTNMQPAVQSIG